MDLRPVILHLDPATLATAVEVWRLSESRGVASRSETYAHLSFQFGGRIGSKVDC